MFELIQSYLSGFVIPGPKSPAWPRSLEPAVLSISPPTGGPSPRGPASGGSLQPCLDSRNHHQDTAEQPSCHPACSPAPDPTAQTQPEHPGAFLVAALGVRESERRALPVCAGMLCESHKAQEQCRTQLLDQDTLLGHRGAHWGF